MPRPDLEPARDEDFQLRVYRADDVDDSTVEFDPDDPPHTFDINDYWAGRNRASRFSARAAA